MVYFFSHAFHQQCLSSDFVKFKAKDFTYIIIIIIEQIYFQADIEAIFKNNNK